MRKALFVVGDNILKAMDFRRYVEQLESRLQLVESEAGKMRTFMTQDSTRREQLLVMKLSSKEAELQDISMQLSDLKAAQAPTAAKLRTTLVDPAVNILIQRLKVRSSTSTIHLFIIKHGRMTKRYSIF